MAKQPENGDDKKSKGLRLKEVRQELSMSADEIRDFAVSRGCKLSETAIANMERGNQNVTHQLAKVLEDNFDIQVNWMLYGHAPKRKSVAWSLASEEGIVAERDPNKLEEKFVGELEPTVQETVKVLEKLDEKEREEVFQFALFRQGKQGR